MTKKKPQDGDDLADLAHVLPPVPSTNAPRRFVSTESGIAVLQSGGTVEEALAADDAQDARWAARLAAEAQEAADRATRRQLDIAERRMRLADRLRRQRAREQGQGSS
ncbi:hypothetical protein [Nocardioides ganghwensis]|uniref:Uncharacterized protein n=1 Tax=Nocardioides ganghwensis TaxID=252230 RepID=A0A4Q2SEP4_9ACTN|nr:hypothetical protein [Nocardioides ganghwensis]MBD3946474.1 hypothetical protein [Nocardioides ganghwensis]RYC03221.1 hypothetical protein EUA07_06610 [Nocardioides ganghwensis]